MSGFSNIAEVVEKTTQGKVDDLITETIRSVSHQVRFANNDVIVTKRWASVVVSIFLVKDKKIASAFVNETNPERIKAATEDLLKFSSAMKPNEQYQGIAEGGPFSYESIPDCFDSRIEDLGDNSIDLVESGINAALEEGAKRTAGVLVHRTAEGYITTSGGVESEIGKTTSLEFTIRAFVDDTASGQGISVGRMLNTVDCEDAGKKAGEIAKKAVGGVNGTPGKYNAILSPTVAANVIAATPVRANPFFVEAGMSWLGDKIGEKIGSECVTVWDDAHVPNGLRSRPFDDEGHPTSKTLLIEEGVLKSFIHNTSTAKRAGGNSTGNSGLVAPQNHNLIFSPGKSSFEELIEMTNGEPTIYVTSNWYTRYTAVREGTFSTIPRDGMFLFEKGEMKPIRELRISENMLNMLSNVIALGKDVEQIRWWEVSTPTFIPPVLIKNVNFSAATK